MRTAPPPDHPYMSWLKRLARYRSMSRARQHIASGPTSGLDRKPARDLTHGYMQRWSLWALVMAS